MSHNTSNYQEYTFPELLVQYDKILVPMIQRDYAQGRTDKKATDVRNNLLTDIFSDKNVHFDLVFGSKEKRIVDGEEKNCFIPVDGQQRLTTLFLLYLYGQKTGKTNIELDLSKFSYDTRRAASDFCKSITSEEWAVPNDKKVSDVIKDSSWFMNYWEKDPTVEGMLNMLDSIHEKSKEITDYPNLNKVTFFFFDLESNGLNENLYLKMNSRGKPLTAFENLKAKIEKVLPDTNKETEWFPENNAAQKYSFKEKWKFFMDRDWTNAFWDEEHPENYDESITKFIVRFLAGYWAAYGTDEEQMANDLKSLNSKDSYADFIPFEPVKKVLELKNAFPSLAYALTIAPTIKPYWPNDTIKVSDKSEYKFLAVIFTYVLFKGDGDAMRFAWNMAENYVAGYDNFVSYCKRVKEICGKFAEVNDFYKALLPDNNYSNPSEQLKEEIAKADKILNGGQRSDGKTWEEIIIDAEKYAFFKGAIRFLFTDGEANISWCDFNTKWENAQKYFNEDGVKDGKENNKLYKSNAILMKSLLANCDDFGNKIWRHFEFSNDANRWKRILISSNWRAAVDAIMKKEITDDATSMFIKKINDPNIKNIVDDGLMNYVCNEMSGAWIRTIPHYNYQAIWINGRPNSRVDLNPILSNLKLNGLISYRNTEGRDSTIPKCRYYKCFGKNVDFKYKFNDKDYYFNWWGTPNETELDVYLTEDNWNDYKKRPNPTSDKGTDEDKFYCFRVTEDMKSNTSLFIDKLKELIEQSQKS